MKKIVFILATVIASLFVWSSCENNTESMQEKVQVFNNSEELFKFSKLHGNILRKTGNKFIKPNFQNNIHSKTNIDTLALLKQYENEAYNFFKDNPIYFNGEIITVNNWIDLPDGLMLEQFRNYNTPENYMSNDTNFYYNLIKGFIDDDVTETPEQFTTAMEGLFNQLESENYNDKDKLAIQLMIGVANDSFTYWYNNAQQESQMSKGGLKSFIRKNLYADVVGAGSWALYGSVAGPLGAVMVGISGAFVGSGVSQAISIAINGN